MAAPHVTGAVALCFEASSRPMSCFDIRSIIINNTDSSLNKNSIRYGAGYLNILKAVHAATEKF